MAGEVKMKLWILRPVDGLADGNNPWDPWFDKCFGFVVRAETEADARQFAHEGAGEENYGPSIFTRTPATKSPWLDPAYSTCDELLSEGEAGIVIEDVSRS